MKPLTIEELQALERGDFVWIEYLTLELGEYVGIINNKSKFVVLRFSGGMSEMAYNDYGKIWLAYKNKEQAEAKGDENND